jgi:hypothetical protein
LTLCNDDTFSTTWPIAPGAVQPEPGVDNLWIQNTSGTDAEVLVLTYDARFPGVVPAPSSVLPPSPPGGYASLTGPGESITPGELDQLGPFTITTDSSDSVGFQVNLTGVGFGIESVENSFIGTSVGDLSVGAGSGLTVASLDQLLIRKDNTGSGNLHILNLDTVHKLIIEDSGAGLELLGEAPNGIMLNSQHGNISIQTDFASLGSIILTAAFGSIQLNGATIGFYGAAPVGRAAHPVTLADVITLLTNLGLCA